MMYPRLYLARNLLREDGVIFISIDDNEAANLKVICDEIFGSENFRADVSWQKRYTRSNNTIDFTTIVEHVFVYSKSLAFDVNLLPRTEDADARYTNPDNDPRGVWKGASFLNPATPAQRPNLCYPIKNPTTGEITYPTTNAWRRSESELYKLEQEGRLYWGKDGCSPVPSIKMFLSEARGLTPVNFWGHDYAGNTDQGTADAHELFGAKVFDNPKPYQLIIRCLEHGSNKDSLILDFFSGSGTTAQAVMQLNLNDGGRRQFICVQLPELIEDGTEGHKMGYRTIADITRARIDKVIAKLKAEHPDKTADLACAHFTLAPSNFKIWNSDIADSGELRQQLALFQSAEKNPAPKPSAQAQTAMLSELLLKHGLGALGVHAVSKSLPVAGVTVHRVLMPDDSVMWLCFEPYSAAFKDEIVKAKPAQVVLLNSCFVGDKADELLANLQLELSGLDIGLTII